MPAPTAKPKSSSAVSRAPIFTQVVLLGAGTGLDTAEAELRLRTVARHHKVMALPPVLRALHPHTHASSTPDDAALALYRLFRAVGRGGPALYLCGGNPSAGALSMLVTDWGNTVLAPNDGTLGLLSQLFTEKNIPHTLSELSAETVLLAEQARMDNPEWQPAEDFTLRDVLAPAAALLLSGTPAKKLAATPTPTQAAGLHLRRTAFAGGLRRLPLRLKESVEALVLPQSQGHLLSLTLDALNFEQLRDDRARFVLTLPSGCRWWPFAKKIPLTVHGPDVHTGSSCRGCAYPSRAPSHEKTCHNHLHLSAVAAPGWDERFLSLHLTGCAAKCLAARPAGVPLRLTRIR